MKEKMTFCEECRKDVLYTEKDVRLEEDLKGETYPYAGKQVVCAECGSKVYVAEVEDFNLKALYDAYREKNGIISLKKILEMPKKYGIGKRPLSALLGWGEITYTRYCDGDMPSKQYSDELKRIYEEPQYYSELLERNKEKLASVVSYEKSKRATEKLLGVQTVPLAQIDIVVNYLLCKCEITPLALQKALYYVQGFYHAFKERFLFEDECEAWVHGPVYVNVYHRYKNYGGEPINSNDECDESEITVSEKAIIDSVIRNFCCYSGNVLEAFTHIESPWLKIRGDLPYDERSGEIIPKQMIGEYFDAVKQQCGMLNPADIEIYSKKMFEQIH